MALFENSLKSDLAKHPTNEKYSRLFFRGIGFDYSEGAKDEALYSTVGNEIEQENYAGASVGLPFLNTHLLILDAPAAAWGHWIAPSSALPHKGEVLFPSGIKFRIEDVVKSNEFKHANFKGSFLIDIIPLHFWRRNQNLSRLKRTINILKNIFIPQ